MYCRNCGNAVSDNAQYCLHCGYSLEANKNTQEYNVSKTGIGVVLGLFLGIIGLIIGICLYPESTLARKSFIKGWLITFIVTIVFAIISYTLLFSLFIFGGNSQMPPGYSY